jgi:hypothetical protein
MIVGVVTSRLNRHRGNVKENNEKIRETEIVNWEVEELEEKIAPVRAWA